MGGVDVGEGGGKGKRSTNAEINMIPFIDLLMVTVAFLLITAVWVTNSRINANAQIPGPPDPTQEVTPQTPEKVLNVHIGAEDASGDAEFTLTWKQGSTVVSEVKVPKPKDPGDPPRYLDLAKKFEAEWNQHGGHKDPSDRKLDQAILHADNRLPFKEIVAVLDALYATQREMKIGNKDVKVPVFNMTFSVR
jgi:biopolymer transport protein ExbD